MENSDLSVYGEFYSDGNGGFCYMMPLIRSWTEQAIYYRQSSNNLDLANWCEEMIHQCLTGNYGRLCAFNGMI